MSVIPTPPTFTDNTAPSIAQLQALAQSVEFLVNTDVRPVWHFYRTSDQSLSSDTWTNMNCQAIAVDSDGVYNASGEGSSKNALVVTPGYYALESCVSMQNQGSNVILFAVCFGIYAGSNNPNLTNGDYYLFGYRAGVTAETGSTGGNSDSAFCGVDVTPWPLYPGDQVGAFAWTNVASTMDYNNENTYQYGRWVCNFTGYWVRQASLTQPSLSTYNLTTSDA